MDEKRRIEGEHTGQAAKRDARPAEAVPRDVRPHQAAKRDATPPEEKARNVRPPVRAAGEVTARLAIVRQGAVKRAQLLDAGISRHVITRRAATGELHRVHRGVYIAGHLALAPHAREAAALLACGDQAVISHRSAAALWGLLEPSPTEVDVTLVTRRRRPKAGIRIHLARRLDRRDIRRRHGIPVTSPARTVVDLAAETTDDELEQAISEARAHRLVREGEIEAALARAGNRRGVARLRAILGGERETGYTRSKAERHMRRLARAARLPPPETNQPLMGCNVDFLWREQKLVVEVDSFRFHGHRGAFERDRRKDQVLLAAGYRVIRVTWRQLVKEPLAVAAAIAAALAAGRAPG